MKRILLDSCDECPYRLQRQCRLAGKEIPLGRFYEKTGFPKSCPLETVHTARQPQVNETMREVVANAFELYRKMCPTLPYSNEFSDARIKRIYKGIVRCKDVEKVLSSVQESDFLLGKHGGWCADFDWIFKPSPKGYEWNVDKILAGKYSQLYSAPKKNPFFQDGHRKYGGWNK